jgi:hypothetical protein
LAIPVGTVIHQAPVRVGRICSWLMLQAPDTVSGVHIAIARAGSDRCQGISWTRLPCFALLRQPCSGAPAAHQPIGTGSAQIRCSPEQASGQMTLRQQQPVVPRVFHQAPARLDEALLEVGLVSPSPAQQEPARSSRGFSRTAPSWFGVARDPAEVQPVAFRIRLDVQAQSLDTTLCRRATTKVVRRLVRSAWEGRGRR